MTAMPRTIRGIMPVIPTPQTPHGSQASGTPSPSESTLSSPQPHTSQGSPTPSPSVSGKVQVVISSVQSLREPTSPPAMSPTVSVHVPLGSSPMKLA